MVRLVAVGTEGAHVVWESAWLMPRCVCGGVVQTGGGVLGRWYCGGGVCMVGVALCLGTVMLSGGGAFGLGGITKDGFDVWLQLVEDGAAPFPVA